MIFRRMTKSVVPAFLLTLILIGVQAYYDHRQVDRMQQGLEHLYIHHANKQDNLKQLRALVRDRMADMSALMVDATGAGTAERVEVLIRALEPVRSEFMVLFQQQEVLAESDDEREILLQLKAEIRMMSELCKQALELLRDGYVINARGLYFDQLKPGHASLLQLLEQVEGLNLENINQELQAMQGEYDTTLKLMDAVALAAVLAISAIGLWLFRRLRADRISLEQANASLEHQVEERTRALSVSNEHLNEAQRLGRMGHWRWQIDSGQLEWSDEIYRIFGVLKGEFEPSYEHFLSAVHPDDREGITLAVERALAGNPYSIEHRVVWPDGSVREVYERGEVRYADGKPECMLGTVHDISEQKYAERELRLAARVFESTGDGVMIADRQNHILNVNEAFQAITGYSLDEVQGRDPKVLKSGRHKEDFYQAMWQSIDSSGQWQGEIWDRHRDGHLFPVWMTINAILDEHGELSNYVGIFRDISQVKQTEQDLWHSAHHDPLTGLPNRSLMYARLQLALSQADRDKRMLAFLLIDLDGFKAVNDHLGHDAGDQVLLHVAKAMNGVVRESDTVARYAGDEFTVLLKGLHSGEEAGQVAEKLLEAIGQPLEYGGETVQVGASIGVALYPANADTAEALIAKADQAMYRAKRGGKNRFHYFGDY